MSRRRLALLFVAALMLMLLVLLPLRLALGAADLAALGLTARDVAGPVWSGRLRAATLQGHPLGDVGVALRAWPLLLGVRQVRLSAPDLSVEVLSGRQVGIEDASGQIAIDRIDSLPGLDLKLRLADVDLRFADGQCVQANGTVRAEVRFDGAAPVQLEGPVRCNGESGELALTATAGPGLNRAQATLSVAADGRYQLVSQVDPTDDATSAALQLAGFQQTPAGLSRIDSGHLLH